MIVGELTDKGRSGSGATESTRHQAPQSRPAPRNLLCQLAGRIDRLDGRPKCQWRLRTGVSYVPGLRISQGM